ncbi:MAG: GNAT family N-acetyltransferase [Planctomycetia bacterium]|nr:GNAT family N-acetyltransferase [Planctomycetia bacterium]
MFDDSAPTILNFTRQTTDLRHVDVQAATCRRLFPSDINNSIMAIENASFEYPWIREDFEYCLKYDRCEGLLAEYNDQPVGYMIYEMRRRAVNLLTYAVAPHVRRRGLATIMFHRLFDKIDAQRPEVVCIVRESNVEAQQFLNSLGFETLWVARGFYSETLEDAYRMTYRPNLPALMASRMRRIA